MKSAPNGMSDALKRKKSANRRVTSLPPKNDALNITDTATETAPKTACTLTHPHPNSHTHTHTHHMMTSHPPSPRVTPSPPDT